MSANTLFTISMSFPFSFRLSVPGISNPFSNSSPPAQTQSQPRRDEKRPPSSLDGSCALPAHVYCRRPSPGPPSTPLVRKRGWVPSSTEPSRPVVVSQSTAGFLDTPAKYRDMSSSQYDQDDGEEVVIDLPPSKRRKGVTGSIISTAFSAALIGAAVGFTVYRMWRDRGKEPEQSPPPPYQEEWVDARIPVTPPQGAPSTQTGPQHSRTVPSMNKRVVGSIRHRQKMTRKAVRTTTAVRTTRDLPTKRSSPQIRQHFHQEAMEEDNCDDSKDEMDWIGDKLARLIEEGKRALGKEIVVASDAPDDEVDDGSGGWVEEPQAFTSCTSPSLQRITLGSSPKLSRYSSACGASTSTFSSPRSPYSRYIHEDARAVAASAPRTPNQSKSLAQEVGQSSQSSNVREAEDEWTSPHIRESMERARAAYRQKHGLGGSGF